jgi:translation initiation factor IF-2
VLESGYEPIVNDTLAYDIYPDGPSEDRSRLVLRPPVVCIMGHVDHGKTTLLDALRKSAVAASEAGGITQHIGAFEVSLKDLMAVGSDADSAGEGPQTITFLDTPGHAAFSAMRSRGAMTTDVAVLVVAADDGVKPQTKEVIELVRQTDIGVVVAITKCDKPGIDLHRTRAGIYDAGIEVEGLGGEVPCVEVSAVSGKGLAELAETILAVAEVRDLRAEEEGVRFEGRVIESDVERGHGNMASVITLRGRLEVGLDIIAGRSYGRVRQLITVSGEPVSEVSPGRPVRVTGWKSLPEAGSLVLGVESEEQAKRACENRVRRFEELGLAEQIELVNERRAQAREAFETGKAELEGMTRRERVAHLRERNQQASAQAKIDSRNEEDSPDCLKLVLKADYTGTVEAVRTAIEGLGNHQVKVKIVSSGVGNISESDARMAIASGAQLVGFNVKIDPMAFSPIESHKVKYTIESVIYRLVDSVTQELVKLLPKRYKERVIGEAKILQIFEINSSSSSSSSSKIKSKVAGCKVSNGEIKKSCSIKILRNKEIIWKGNIHTHTFFFLTNIKGS